MKHNRPLSINPADDGVTHYNVRYKSAQTNLGLRLAVDFPYTFEHPALGPFESVEAYWHYLTTYGINDKVRQLNAENQPSRRLRQIIQKNTYQIDNFYDYIEDALWVRLDQDEDLKTQLRATSQDLPFVHYDIFKGSAGDIALHDQAMYFYTRKLNLIRLVLQGKAERSTVDYTDFLNKARGVA